MCHPWPPIDFIEARGEGGTDLQVIVAAAGGRFVEGVAAAPQGMAAAALPQGESPAAQGVKEDDGRLPSHGCAGVWRQKPALGQLTMATA
jgi:hypothetical protein